MGIPYLYQLWTTVLSLTSIKAVVYEVDSTMGINSQVFAFVHTKELVVTQDSDQILTLDKSFSTNVIDQDNI